MASSVSGQDELNYRALSRVCYPRGLSCPLGTTRPVLREKFSRNPRNKSFIDQSCSVKMAGYWLRSFFASLWTPTPSRSMNTLKQNYLGQYPAISTSRFTNNPYVLPDYIENLLWLWRQVMWHCLKFFVDKWTLIKTFFSFISITFISR